MERRDFLKMSGAFGSVAILKPAAFFEVKAVPLGIQLWSVRDAMAKDPKGTLKAIAQQGYKIVEPFGYQNGTWFGMAPKELKSFVKDLGMKMPSCHHFFTSKAMNRKTGQLSDDFKKEVEASKLAGHKFFVFPYVVPEEQTPEMVKVIVEMINKMAEYTHKQGLQFAYHNHAFEFQVMVDGVSMYEYIAKQTDPRKMQFEMDMGWVHRASQLPADWFAKYPGRFPLSHMKDMESTETDTSVIIGNGIVDFTEIIKHKKLAGMKHWIIELEHYKRSSVEDIGVCYNNLRKLI